MSTTKKKFTAAIHEYHYYRDYWSPQENGKFICLHKTDNHFDVLAIRTSNKVTKFLMNRGENFTATLHGTKYRRSLFV